MLHSSPQKCVISASWKKEGDLFCCSDCSTGQKVKYDKEGHFMNITNSLYKVFFRFDDKLSFLQSTKTSVSTIRQSILFNISASYNNGKDITLKRIIFQDETLTDNIIKE